MAKQIDETDMKQRVGKRVRYWRRERKITQEGLADMLDVSNTTISRIENGNQLCSVFQIMNLAKVLCITPGDLLNVYNFESDKAVMNIDEEIVDLCRTLSCEEKEYVRLYLKMMLEMRMKKTMDENRSDNKLEDIND